MILDDKILCLCARQNFDDAYQRRLLALCEGESIDWAAVFKTAETHCVSPLIHVNLEKAGVETLAIPEDVRAQFKTAYIHNVLLVKGSRKALRQALALFGEAGDRVMLVKGAAYNIAVYDHPWYMISGDIDLIVKGQKEAYMTGGTRHVIEQLDAINSRRNQFQILIEYDFDVHHDIDMNGMLAVDAGQFWERAYRIQLLDQDVWILPPEELLLTAAINSCRKRFLRLKSLCDIASIIEKYPDLDWDRVLATATEWRMQIILFTALMITQRTVGCTVPGSFAASLGVSPRRQRLILNLIDRLLQKPLNSTATGFGPDFSGRRFSWSVPLTYAAFPSGLLAKRARLLWLSWRNSSQARPTG